MTKYVPTTSGRMIEYPFHNRKALERLSVKELMGLTRFRKGKLKETLINYLYMGKEND